MHFAKWVYHKTKGSKIVHSEEAFKALDGEWAEKPFCEGEYPFELDELKKEPKEEPKKRGRPAKAKE